MDKKNTIIGVALLIVGTILMFKNGQQAQQQRLLEEQAAREAAEAAQNAPAIASDVPSADPTVSAPSGRASTPPAVIANGHAQIEINDEKTGEEIVTLENGLAEFRFTNYGGALREIVLKDQPKSLDSDEPYIMNHLRYAPALNLTTYLGDARNIAFEQVPSASGDSVTYRGVLNEQLEVIRTYTISQELEGAAPYNVSHELTVRNLTDGLLPLGEMLLNIGTAAPSGDQDRFLQTFGYSNGEDVEFTEQSDFMGGGIPFFKKDPKDMEQVSDTIEWASIKNQFFITLLTPNEPAAGYIARPVDFPGDKDGEPKTGITADIKLEGINLPANASVTKTFDFYAGPKEHGRIAKLSKGQEQAMQFGFFGFISKLLLQIMNWVHGIVGNWGIAIILLTIIVRGSLLPITLMSMKSMKKMSKISEPMKALKEKFPDDTQKQQQMMMELYKLNKINPVAGCLPMLAQIPIFFALFYMLRSAAELRFADFLWIADLSKPDTVATIPNMPFFGDFAVNLLPFVWLISLAYQMWTMPTPSVDNAQAKMMKFMPFIFFPFTYTFSSGLVLYWTVSNVFTIGQQWLVKRGGDEFEVVLPPALKKALEGGDTKKKRRKNK
ncbi:membrane protein insertase YidC [Pelagicoccus sp. SDUM812002]|uniref:membrane protein insertase YidC n=1 Tax=Pelagicoccus sp. SDUM812002 TaxID=3041266 RepID=UPI00281094A1|nr:membrane protein insertase YidC [Pelagicoccus sp. SDUM812002]MDQ8184690.1 membrane protein insertase YidC [Pelagicoccus sp. SDUM812002]